MADEFMSMDDIGRELGWDDEIEKEAPEYVTLPEGDYDFKIIGFERQRYTPNPGAKLPPCNMAVLNIDIPNQQGLCTIQHRLYLHTRMEGRLSEFFASIGQKKKGERVRMNWNMVPGATGKCRVTVNKYTDKDGNERTNNRISKFYEKEQKTWQAGAF